MWSMAVSPQVDEPLNSVMYGQCDVRPVSSPSQLQGITAPLPLPNCTAWWGACVWTTCPRMAFTSGLQYIMLRYTNNMSVNHTHTHPFNGPLSGTTQVSRNQKGKTNLDFTGARDSERQSYQLGHMQVCTSLQTDNHASTSLLVFLQARCPSCRPTNSVKALKANVNQSMNQHLFTRHCLTHQVCMKACHNIFMEISRNFPPQY